MAESRLRKLAAELRAYEDDDEITETQIIVQPGATVHVDQTGRHRAMTDAQTKPDNQPPRAEQDSLPERAADAVGDVVDRVKTWRQVVALGLLVAALCFVAWLQWGK